jgi:hypothetical protein
LLLLPGLLVPPLRESLVKAIIAAGVPAGLTGVRLDGYPKSQEVPIGVSEHLGSGCRRAEQLLAVFERDRESKREGAESLGA